VGAVLYLEGHTENTPEQWAQQIGPPTPPTSRAHQLRVQLSIGHNKTKKQSTHQVWLHHDRFQHRNSPIDTANLMIWSLGKGVTKPSLLIRKGRQRQCSLHQAQLL